MLYKNKKNVFSVLCTQRYEIVHTIQVEVIYVGNTSH